jgi:transcriptional regulator with XRE-family HTH domain
MAFAMLLITNEGTSVAKIMDSASPRALSRVLKDRALTRQELAEKAKVDRKTVQKIDEGQPVKRETLAKVADVLRVPVDHLKAHNEANVVGPPSAEVQAAPGGLLLKKLSAAELPELLQKTARLHWRLELPVVEPKLHPTLEKLEEIIEALRVSLNAAFISQCHTLRSQLHRVATLGEIEALLKELHAERIAFFGATYLFWESSTDDVIHYEGRTWGGADHFTSTQVTVLCIDHSNLDSKRVIVDAGSKPPRYSTEVDVFVDGVLLKTRAEAELDDDLPF